MSSGGETVMLVGNEPSLRGSAQVILEESGYRVLVAATPREAIRRGEEHASEIALLITDVIMPEMNGLNLAKWLQIFYPDMKILFMSGNTTNVIFSRSVPDEGVDFIQKPFSMQELAVKVRHVLQGACSGAAVSGGASGCTAEE